MSHVHEERLRDRNGAARVLPVELFFDLVYVLAITQLTHHMLGDLTWRGAGETLVLLLVVWLGWIHITWLSNYFDVHQRSIRVTVIVLMLASLVSSAAIPEAFDDRGLAFVAGFCALWAGSSVWALWAVGPDHILAPTFRRVIAWEVIVVTLLFAGSFAEGDARLALWIAAMALAYGAMWFGFPVPGLGHSHTTDYTISGDHMAERFLLFVTIALGESIIITGSNFGDLPNSAARMAAFVVAFAGTVAFWWLYFDRAAEAAGRVIAESDDPGRLGLIAYTYVHIVMVAGIIVAAAGDEIAIAHPTEEVSFAEAAVILGGPVLYLVGNSLFKLTVWGHVPISRIAGLVGLTVLAAVAMEASALVLQGAATAVFVAVAAYDFATERRHMERFPEELRVSL